MVLMAVLRKSVILYLIYVLFVLFNRLSVNDADKLAKQR